MTPRDLRPEIIQNRLANLQLLLTDLDRVGVVTADQLRADRFLRHVVEHVLSQLVQLAAAINAHVAAALLGEAVTDYRSSFDAAVRAGLVTGELGAALKPSVGLRNIVVHAYVDIDLAIVAAALPAARRDYGAYVRSVAEWLTTRG